MRGMSANTLRAPACTTLVALLLVAASGCDWLWPRDNRFDPGRCKPACSEGQVCRAGDCVPADGSVVSEGSAQERSTREQGAGERGPDGLPGVDASRDGGSADAYRDGGQKGTLWAVQVTGGSSSLVAYPDVAVDSAGNIYLVGIFKGSVTLGTKTLTTSNQAIFIAALGSSGTFKWSQKAELASPGTVLSASVVEDGAGFLAVSGNFNDSLTFDTTTLTPATGKTSLFVARLDASSGNLKWAKATGGSANLWAPGLAHDSSQNILLAGYYIGTPTIGSTTLSTNGGAYNSFVARVSSTGAFSWALDGGGSGSALARAVAVDNQGALAIIGDLQAGPSAMFGASTITSKGSTDIFVARTDTSDQWYWAVAGGGTGEDHGADVTIDKIGNIYLVGSVEGATSFGACGFAAGGGMDVLVAKLSTTSFCTFASASGGSGDEYGEGIALDGSGNLHITGSFKDPGKIGKTSLTAYGGGDAFVAELDSSGNWRWATSAGGSSADTGAAIAVDASGGSLATGHFTGQATFGTKTLTAGSPYFDIYLWKIAAGGP
jgi:hypothetical protein